jgi:hypothetical protein
LSADWLRALHVTIRERIRVSLPASDRILPRRNCGGIVVSSDDYAGIDSASGKHANK